MQNKNLCIKYILKTDTLEWLLGKDNPSVRYFTLIDLLDKPADNKEVIKARKSIITNGPVPIILSKQEAGGY